MRGYVNLFIYLFYRNIGTNKKNCSANQWDSYDNSVPSMH